MRLSRLWSLVSPVLVLLGCCNPYSAMFVRLTPLLPSARGSSSWELGVRRVAKVVVAPCIVSSSESECCELLYLRFVCVLQEGCSCCRSTSMASVVTRCVRAMVAWLPVDLLAVVFPVWRTRAGKSMH
ncbi:hypothetical protein Taro_026411, partial [Colocasia esculenta]|nr:hypothetical protein [Colocasia esculenta]